jgi:GNAT superfamily N-acetyltransferase
MARIRRITAKDKARWKKLWDGYTRFYEREPSAKITEKTWAKIMDPSSPVKAIVAEDRKHGVIGIANYIVHDSTSSLAPVCYLQDLFVEPGIRGKGVGRQLIDWLVLEARAKGWSRVYWMTRETNYRARGLYDKYGPHSGFLRYVIEV